MERLRNCHRQQLRITKRRKRHNNRTITEGIPKPCRDLQAQSHLPNAR
jgi:hypothetical protein